MLRFNSYRTKQIFVLIIFLLTIFNGVKSSQAEGNLTETLVLTDSQYYDLNQFTNNKDQMFKLKIKLKDSYEDYQLIRIYFAIFESSLETAWINYLDNYFPEPSLEKPQSVWESNARLGLEWEIELQQGDYIVGFAMSGFTEVFLSFTLKSAVWTKYSWVWIVTGILSFSLITVVVLLSFQKTRMQFMQLLNKIRVSVFERKYNPYSIALFIVLIGCIITISFSAKYNLGVSSTDNISLMLKLVPTLIMSVADVILIPLGNNYRKKHNLDSVIFVKILAIFALLVLAFFTVAHWFIVGMMS